MAGNHGRFPFASTTGDTDYGLFFTPREMELFDNYNEELLGIFTKSGQGIVVISITGASDLRREEEYI